MNKLAFSELDLGVREERWRLALDGAKLAVWDWDVATDAVFYSKEWKHIRGISEGESYGNPAVLFAGAHPEDQSERESQKKQWLDGLKDNFQSKRRVRHRSGAWVCISEQVKVVRDRDGKVSRLVGAETEIAHAKDTQHHSAMPVSKVNETPQTVLDEFPIAMLRFKDGKCVCANEAWSQLSGRPVESALGNGYSDAIHSEDRSRLIDHQQKVGNGPAGETVVVEGFEGRLQNPDGTEKWFSSKLCMRYSADGKLASKTVTLNDITQSKQLEQHQDRLIAILEATTDFVCTANSDRQMLWCNQRFSELRPDLDFHKGANCMDKYSASGREIIQEIAIPEAIKHGSWSGEVDILDSVGNAIPVSQVLIAHKAQDGTLEYFSAIMRDIREIKTANHALQASQRKFAILVAASPVAILQMDVSGSCIYVNERWSEMTGRSIESALGLGYQDAICPNFAPGINKGFQAFAEDSKQLVTEPVEGCHVLPDGSHNWFQMQLSKLFDDDGNISGYIGALTDISKVKEAEEKLRAMSERLELVLESAAVGTFEFNPADDSLIWDDQSLRMFGVRSENFGGTSEDFLQRIHPDDRDRIESVHERLFDSADNRIEFKIVRPDGETRHLFANTTVLRNELNEPVKVIGLSIDLTELRTTQLALEETQTHLQVLTDNVPSMLYRYIQYPDGTHEAPFVSQGARDLFGVEPREAMKNIDTIFERIHPEDTSEYAKLAEESAKDLAPFRWEYRINHPQKGLRWVQAISKPTRRDDGAVVWDGLAIDITQRKEAEIQLQKAKMKDEFLANVSHELRTPLNAMLGMAEGLQDGIFGPVTTKQLDSLKVIEQSGAHLLDLINEMLDLAKIEAGEMELYFSAVDVRLLCESSLGFVTPQANKKNIQLTLNAPWNIPRIKADEKRLRQVLINLLNNAVKFTPDGGQVSIEVQRILADENHPEETLRIAVIDTGIGIESHQLDSLFVPFVQVDSSLNRSYEGTGLGLALVKQYVELHGGTVSVTSQSGSGSCFEIKIPFCQICDVNVSSPKLGVDSSSASSPPDLPKSKDESPLVLLCEDNEDIASVVSIYLGAKGFRVLHATDGEMGIKKAIEHSPDVILMDIQMPGVDGLEATKRLRQMPGHRKTPIIAVTGLAREFDASRCIAAGANQYLSKPYRMSDLSDTIRNLLEKQAIV